MLFRVRHVWVVLTRPSSGRPHGLEVGALGCWGPSQATNRYLGRKGFHTELGALTELPKGQKERRVAPRTLPNWPVRGVAALPRNQEATSGTVEFKDMAPGPGCHLSCQEVSSSLH